MRCGFTGTSTGMNEKQKRDLIARLKLFKPTEFHHGDCIGADAEAHAIVRWHFPECKIVLHPPVLREKRAFCKADEELKARDYLTRNQRIVDSCETLFAAPKRDYEELRSGTWATVRYARRTIGKNNIIMLYPI